MKLSQVVESLLFASQEPLSVKTLVKTIRTAAKELEGKQREKYLKVSEKQVTDAIKKLNKEYDEHRNAVTLVEGVTGWKYYTRPEYGDWVRHLFPGRKPERLSAPAMETLAIIAYRQPITKADIEAVRGVSVDGVMHKLIDRGLVHISGRAEVPGRPLLYATTEFFLEHFGVKNLDELPNAAELKFVELPKAEVPSAPEEEAEAGADAGEGTEGDEPGTEGEELRTEGEEPVAEGEERSAEGAEEPVTSVVAGEKSDG